MRIRCSVLTFTILALGLLGAIPGSAQGDRSAVIALSSHTIDIHSAEARVPEALKSFAGEAGGDVVLVKFPGPVSAAQLRALESRVERIYTYLPHDTFLVRLPATKQHRLAEDAVGASWTGVYHPAYKISPGVASLDLAKAGEQERMFLVHVFPDADLEAVRERLAQLTPSEIVGSRGRDRFSRIRLLAKPSEIVKIREEVARMPEVFWIDLEARRVLLNDTTLWVAQSGTAGGQATPVHDQGILGEGQIVAVLDTGVDPDMCFFRDPARGLPPINACNGGTVVDNQQRKVIAVDFLWSNECNGGISSNEWDTQDHGTHVAGTLAGDNFANPLSHDPGDGLAPGAKLVIQDCGFQTNNCADCPGIGCPVVDLNPIFQQTYDQGARIHNNSWGDDENNPNGGLYSAGSEDADEFMWNHKDFLLVFANGNSGPGSQTVLSPATGKNVLSVGATSRGSSAESMASFSSCGPTVDGRIKPDITMPGSSIISANSDNNTGSNNCNTKSSSGTSMASPGAAGAAALVRQYYTDGFYPSGAATPGDGFTPSAALLKATLVNSGHDMGNVAAIPSLCQGWGRIQLDNTLQFSGSSKTLFVEDDNTGFAQGSSGEDRTFGFNVASGEPLRVTLVWTDFPSTPAASTNLVNDLDLIVTGPGGATYRGNVFSGGQSSTGGSPDRLNTVEQVRLDNPPAGSYSVTVRSFTVPSGPQPFALVVTAAQTASCSLDSECDDGLFCNGAETCSAGTCQAGSNPCSGGESCLEDGDLCVVCLHDASFESGAGGWAGGASSCSTGSFVVGTPDATAWQVGGGNPGQAFFTQPNPGGIGSDDVDGGTCEALSPSIDASGQSEVSVSLDYFHGQRDAADDAGDGFSIELLNNGSVVETLVSIGDVTNNPVWTSVSTTVSNPGNLQLRVRATDGAAGGDIVEGGIDNVLVCPTGPPTGCTQDSQCDNGLFCDGTETCNTGTGVCQAGTAPCPGGACDEGGDVCLECSLDSDCDDGLFCNGAETCFAGSCQAGSDPCPGQGCDESGNACVPAGNCSHGVDFESGAGGWAGGADTCTTGAFVVGTPDATAWQVGGGNPGQAFFTQPNPNGIGGDDVDGGTCEALSPVVDCGGEAAAEVALDYFHGQRDAGDDAGDGFTVEVLNNGVVVDTLVAIGDVTNNPAWSRVSTVVSNPGNLQVRVRATDGTGGGDIVEGGVDNVSISPTTPPAGCSVEESFESGAGGWTNSAASTCSTGAFVTATPSQQTNGGVTTQVGGDHTSGTGNAYFSATNTSAGANDVDGGNCIVTSPVYAVAEASDLSIWYFHGQRDAGTDAGDFFRLELSTDGGSSWTDLVSLGDVTSNAAWTEATASVPAGSDVQLRVQVADGTAAGDLIEAGVDDLAICPTP